MHGMAVETDGLSTCVCHVGYAGAACDSCATGYQDQDGDGRCLPDCMTANLACVLGTCSDAQGVARCECRGHVVGKACERCASGFAGALCDICAEGHAGAECDECEHGYQDHDLNGTCTPACGHGAARCGEDHLCVDVTGTAVCAPRYPQSCVEYKEGHPEEKADGLITLFVDRDPSKPWQAHCVGMDSFTPVEYLPLEVTGQGHNYSEYLSGGHIWGDTVVTQWFKLRMDPRALVINVHDFTFATSVGSVTNGTWTTTQMDYAHAAACNAFGWVGTANVDLAGTPFALALTQSFCASGWAETGSASISDDGRMAHLSGGGQCGFVAACPGSGDGWELQLDYVGP